MRITTTTKKVTSKTKSQCPHPPVAPLALVLQYSGVETRIVVGVVGNPSSLRGSRWFESTTAIMEIKQTTRFKFQIKVGEDTYNFSMDGDTEKEAKEKLHDDLILCLHQIDA